MLDLNLLQRPWYIRQEQRAHPEVFAGAEREMNDFYHEVAPFENGEPFDGARIERAFVAMLDTIITRQLPQRPVYIRDTYQVGHSGVAEKMKMIPGGYFMRITTVPAAEPVIDAEKIADAVTHRDERVNYLLHSVASAGSYHGKFAMQSGDTVTVRRTLDACRQMGADDAPDIAEFMRSAATFLSVRSGGER